MSYSMIYSRARSASGLRPPRAGTADQVGQGGGTMAEKVVNTDFTQIDRSADAGHFVRHLDRIRTGAQVQAYKRRTVDLLDVREGSHALDVGCGTGDDARAI